MGQGLAVGACAAAPGCQNDGMETELGCQLHRQHDVNGCARKDNCLWRNLIDRIVGGEHGPVGIADRDITAETRGTQLLQKT